jgi:hypothetical protein
MKTRMRVPNVILPGRMMPLFENVLLDMALESGGTVHIDDVGLLVYVKDDRLYLRYADGHTVCKSIADVRSAHV